MTTPENFIVYDLETQRTFAEVGGYEHHNQLGVSYVGVYSFTQDKFFGFFEQDIQKLEAIMQHEQPTIIGFNSISFDNQVLQPYFKSLDISTLPQIDILAEIYEQLGFRMKLESVAQTTLGEGKSGSGLDAIKYYREGNLDALAKYCMDDVRITRDIYNFGRDQGFILYTSGGDTKRMPVSWASETSVTDLLTQALQNHTRINITYLQITDETKQRVETEIDILGMTDKTIDVYCHVSHDKRTYQIERILRMETTNTQYAYQGSLL